MLAFLTFDRDSAPALTSAMIAHPAIKRVNFTGSDGVGRSIAQQCGAHLKQCVLELGGSAPTVVFADADLRQAAKAIISGGMLHGGQVSFQFWEQFISVNLKVSWKLQVCMSTERVFVEVAAANVFFSELKSVATEWIKNSAGRAGPVPPLLNPASARRVVNLVARAISEGATDILATVGSDQSAGGHGGSTVAPSILVGVTPEMAITRSEIFGPGSSRSSNATRTSLNRLSSHHRWHLHDRGERNRSSRQLILLPHRLSVDAGPPAGDARRSTDPLRIRPSEWLDDPFRASVRSRWSRRKLGLRKIQRRERKSPPQALAVELDLHTPTRSLPI